MLPPIPHNEEKRMKELMRCGLLDTPPDPAYDRITRLAARIFHTPTALISLVDRDRQWFKSRFGCDLEETSRHDAFCAHTILAADALVILDAQQDERFARSQLVVGPPHVRFYAGMPLTSPSGERIGTLCVIDSEPRTHFGAREVGILRDLTAMAEDELELRFVTVRSQLEIDQRKHADKIMRAAREELELRVQQRTAELTQTNAALCAAEAKYRGIFENAVEGIYQTLPDGTLLSANPAFARLLGYPSPQNMIEEVVNFGSLYVDSARRAEFQRFVQEAGSVESFESELWRAGGVERIWISENARAVRDADGALLCYEGTVEDVSTRRAAEESLRQAREDLEGHIRERTAELALANGNLRLLLQEREEADATLRRSEAKFRAMIENAQDIISILGPAGVMLYQSPSVERVFGYKPEELVGKSVFEFMHRDDQAAITGQMRQIFARGETYARSEARMRHRDGTWRLIESIGSRTPTDSPIDGLVVNSRDITERRRHEEALQVVEARYQRIVANTPGMVFQFMIRADQSVAMLFVSEESRVIYGVEPEAFYVRTSLFWETIHPDDRPRLIADGRAAQASLEPLAWQGRIVLPSGDVNYISIRTRPERLPNGDTIWDGVVIDVSELKRAEAAMQAAKEEAERANEAKSEFLSRISHELRTPLNAIIGFGQLLEIERLTASQNCSVEQIVRGGRHLLGLINEVLDISRIESGHMEFQWESVRLGEVLSSTVMLVEPLANARDIHVDKLLKAGGGAEVLADRVRLGQVLLNLVSNAIKYNYEGGRVSFDCENLVGGRVRLAIRDTGPGMTEDEIHRLFMPFERLGAARRGIDGTGLGLTISRSLIEAMGGSLTVSSEPGSGSAFFVELPAAPRHETAAAFERGPESQGGDPETYAPRRTVLHIEDQRVSREWVEQMLYARPDLRLLESMDGESGVMRARIGKPDLILLDLELPDVDGEEVLRRLRADPLTAGIPVIAVGAEAAPANWDGLRELGVNIYLAKPLDMARFLHVIDDALVREGV